MTITTNPYGNLRCGDLVRHCLSFAGLLPEIFQVSSSVRTIAQEVLWNSCLQGRQLIAGIYDNPDIAIPNAPDSDQLNPLIEKVITVASWFNSPILKRDFSQLQAFLNQLQTEISHYLPLADRRLLIEDPLTHLRRTVALIAPQRGFGPFFFSRILQNDPTPALLKVLTINNPEAHAEAIRFSILFDLPDTRFIQLTLVRNQKISPMTLARVLNDCAESPHFPAIFKELLKENPLDECTLTNTMLTLARKCNVIFENLKLEIRPAFNETIYRQKLEQARSLVDSFNLLLNSYPIDESYYRPLYEIYKDISSILCKMSNFNKLLRYDLMKRWISNCLSFTFVLALSIFVALITSRFANTLLHK